MRTSEKSVRISRHLPWYVLILYSVIGILAYSNTFEAGYHLDDWNGFVNTTALQNIFAIPTIWDYGSNRFLPYLTFAFNKQLFGDSLAAYHSFNLCIHILASFFTFRLISLALQILRTKKEIVTPYEHLVALFSGLIFLTHPLQTQAVTYLIQRMTSLSALFVILGVYHYLSFRYQERFRHLVFSLFFASCGMLSKENAYTIIPLLLLCEMTFFSINARNLITSFRFLCPFIALALATVFLTSHQKLIESGFSGLTRADSELPRMHYLFTQLNVIRTYIRLLFLPVGQTVDYDYPLSKHFLEPATIASFVFLCTVVFFAVKIFHKQRMVAFGIFWFFITLSIESSIFSIGDVIFEHRLYLPMVGFAVCLIEGIRLLFKRRKEFIVFSIAMVTVLSVLTFMRNFIWKNEITLWQDGIKKSPRKTRPYLQLSSAYILMNHHEQAIAYLQKALKLNPSEPDVYYRLESAYRQLGRLNEALTAGLKAIEINPKDPEYHFAIGRTYEAMGDWVKAEASYLETIRLESFFPQAYNNLGALYYRRHDDERAIQYYRKALEQNENYGDAYYNLGLLFSRKKDYASAAMAYLEAIKRDLKNSEYYYELGLTYFNMSDYTNALRYAQTSLHLSPRSVDTLSLLAMIYQKIGDQAGFSTQLQKMRELGYHDIAEKIQKSVFPSEDKEFSVEDNIPR